MWHDPCFIKLKQSQGHFMKVLTSKKAIISILSLGSIVLAGTIKDFNSRSVSKVETTIEDFAPERNVASDEALQRVARMYVPMNAENLAKINAKWEIMRIIGSDEVVTYDKLSNPEDKRKSLKVDMRLVGTSLVQLDADKDLVYNISLLSEFGTIALFKKMGNGFEIIEAKLVLTKKAKEEAIEVEGDKELVLERALNQAKSTKILTGDDASGEMTLSKGSISGLTVDLKNTNGETQSINIGQADLMDGGSFKAEVDGEEVSGVVFNNGKDGYRLSFVTGPLAGAMLNFVTKEQLDQIEEKSADFDAYAQEEEQRISAMAQNEAVEERQIASNEQPENYEPVRVLSADEIKETAETQGFAF